MDITNPINLWKDYDVLALPLNALPLSDKTENGIAVKEYYFDGYTTVDGKVRTYIKFYCSPEHKGVILLLDDQNDPDKRLAQKLVDYGYTVAVMDYLGKSDNMRYTFYPASLAHCNLYGKKSFAVQEDTQNNWYIWACLARRAVKLAEQLYPQSKLYALGVGFGGTTVYKLASFDDGLTACATLLNIIPEIDGSGNSLINYRASLDNSAYAQYCSVPMYMAVSSNDDDGSLDDMSELAQTTKSLEHFRIVERAFSGGICKAYIDIDRFFTLCAEHKRFLPQPKVFASNSEGNMYLNINIDELDKVDEYAQLNLYVSFCSSEPQFRNWMNIPAISLGVGKYIAKINVCDGTKPIHAFANLKYSTGEIISSPLIETMPKSIGVTARSGVIHHKIYDGSMGEDGWTARDGGNIGLVKGPYDIEGITCDTNTLTTFKLGDPLFKVMPDTTLQLMISGAPQLIEVSVSDKTNTYSCTVELKNENDWHKFTLNHMNFKSENGMLTEWSKMLLLEFKGSASFVIGSVLWV